MWEGRNYFSMLPATHEFEGFPVFASKFVWAHTKNNSRDVRLFQARQARQAREAKYLLSKTGEWGLRMYKKLSATT